MVFMSWQIFDVARNGRGFLGAGMEHLFIVGIVGVAIYGPAIFFSAIRGNTIRVTNDAIVAPDGKLSLRRIRRYQIIRQEHDGTTINLMIVTQWTNETRIYGVPDDILLDDLHRLMCRLGVDGKMD